MARVSLLLLALLAACEDRTPVVEVPELDAGGLSCRTGEAPRFGACVCATDLACGAGEYCEAVTGRCRALNPGPDAGQSTCLPGARRCAPAAADAGGSQAVQECRADGWMDVEACPAEGECTLGPQGVYCAVCRRGETRCQGETTLQRCDDLGAGWVSTPCPAGPDSSPSRCRAGQCESCTPGAQRCSPDGKTLDTCRADGTGWTASTCAVTGKCVATPAPGDGGTVLFAACVPPSCMPGTRTCKDGTHVLLCRADGLGTEEKDCRSLDRFATPEATCVDDECLDPCAAAARESSYLGCEYWAAVTSNTQLDGVFTGGAVLGTQPDAVSEFGLVVSNPNPVAVKVKVLRMKGGVEQAAPSDPAPDASGSLTVAPGALQVIRLPWQAVSETGVRPYAYRLLASRPVSAHQFNPVVASKGGVSSRSNDASLLIPAHILGGDYVVLGQEHIALTIAGMVGCLTDADCPGAGNRCQDHTCTQPRRLDYPAFFSIVAPQGGTRVTVRFSAATLAAKSGGAVAAQARNSTASYVLDRYEVLQFWSAPEATPVECVDYPAGAEFADACRYDSDPTGTLIRAVDVSDPTVERPVAVFSGADCTFKPFNKFACDHVEEMMLPFSTWGRSYAGAKSAAYRDGAGKPIASPSPDYWRVVGGCGKASCPQGTRLTIEPPPLSVVQAGYCQGNVCTLPPLDPGSASPTAAWLEFKHPGDFTVLADQPVMLSQYFTGENANAGSAEGDPSLILTPPVEQWRTSYHLLASPTLAHNYLSLAAQTAAAGIRVDGKDLTAANFPGLEQRQIPGGGFVVYTVPVAGGSHRIEAQAKVGVTIYGYDRYVSYGYTGGLDLQRITVIAPGG